MVVERASMAIAAIVLLAVEVAMVDCNDLVSNSSRQ